MDATGAAVGSNVPQARELLDTSIFLLEKGHVGDAMRRLREARDLMTRTVIKKRVDLGNKMTPAIREQIGKLVRERTDLADVEISEMVFGNGAGCGRVSEIRAALA